MQIKKRFSRWEFEQFGKLICIVPWNSQYFKNILNLTIDVGYAKDDARDDIVPRTQMSSRWYKAATRQKFRCGETTEDETAGKV